MSERQEQLAQLEQALLDATLQSPDCTRDQLARALMAMDSDLPEAQACPSAACPCTILEGSQTPALLTVICAWGQWEHEAHVMARHGHEKAALGTLNQCSASLMSSCNALICPPKLLAAGTL